MGAGSRTVLVERERAGRPNCDADLPAAERATTLEPPHVRPDRAEQGGFLSGYRVLDLTDERGLVGRPHAR